jgi:DNA-binding NarL/FixJ family response regulator
MNGYPMSNTRRCCSSRLVLSVTTVQNHVSNILNKLQSIDRTQAIVRARDAGFGKGGTT